jgi:signal transduction histidine kinase
MQNSWLRYQNDKTNAELIHANELLLEMNASKDTFFSIISHDLRSPFNSMLGLSDLLMNQVEELDRSEVAEYAQIIHSSAQKAFKLLQNLLDWARSQTGRITFQPEDIHLQSIVVDVIDTLADVCKDKQITVKYSFMIDDHIYADKNMIESIIRNLLTNAIKFTKRGGKINITVSGSVDETIVAIQDNGIGIAPEKIDRLFLINERTTTEGTEKEQGTGLGLILCKEFVDKHGGEIRVESTVGVGSIFTFTIPRKAS